MPKTISEYIAAYPKEVQIKLNELRKTILEIAPNVEEKMTYGIPTFKLSGNLVHFATFKNHIGFYPTPSGIINFKAQLKNYKTSKGCIQFQLNDPIPFDLIKKIVKYRVEEDRKKSSLKLAK